MFILSCDHAGFEYVQRLMKDFDLKKQKYKYFGPKTLNVDDDYPDFVAPAAAEVAKSKNNIGIFVCGSGIGANIVANRQKGVRAVCALTTDSAYWARHDDNANVLTSGARFISYKKFVKIIDVFLTTKFEGGRHLRRINKY